MPHMQEEIEMSELLLHYCQTVRRSKRPQLAMQAAKWEVRLQDELSRLRQIQTTDTQATPEKQAA